MNVGVPSDAATPATRTAREGRTWVNAAGRIGIASRGVIYIVLAYLAFDIARHGSAPVQTSSSGALEELEARSGGALLLIVLGIGLGCYALWRFFDAVTGSGGAAKRAASLAVGVIYAVLCVRAVQLLAGHAATGTGSNPEPWVAKAMGWSDGTLIVGLAGAAVLGAGLALAVWGVLHRYEKNLALERLSPRWRAVVKVLGALGDGARGVVIGLVGVYLIQAAVTDDAAHARSVDAALRALVHHPFGAVALGALAIGLLSFGVFSFFDARLRRL